MTSTQCGPNARASSRAKVQTPPAVSAVISTRRMEDSDMAGLSCLLPARFELNQRKRTAFLNVAESAETRQISFMRPLPGEIIRRAPAACVVGGTGIREHRHRLVGPHSLA